MANIIERNIELQIIIAMKCCNLKEDLNEFEVQYWEMIEKVWNDKLRKMWEKIITTHFERESERGEYMDELFLSCGMWREL